MICKNCNSFIDEKAKFCMFCGTETIKKFCSHCGSIMPEIANYCSECGQQLSNSSLSGSTNILETTDAEEDYGYEDYDEYDEEEDYEKFSDDEYIDETSEFISNTNIPTLDNYKSLGIEYSQNFGHIVPFWISCSGGVIEDPYSYIYSDKEAFFFEKCNLYGIYNYVIVSDGIFYATQNEVIYLHKNGLRFRISIDNICGLTFNDDILTITHILSAEYLENWEQYNISVTDTHYTYSYILDNMS